MWLTLTKKMYKTEKIQFCWARKGPKIINTNIRFGYKLSYFSLFIASSPSTKSSLHDDYSNKKLAYTMRCVRGLSLLLDSLSISYNQPGHRMKSLEKVKKLKDFPDSHDTRANAVT